MNTSFLRNFLWLHTAIAAIAGLVSYLFPSVLASVWPWPLPGLAARFMASLLIAAAVYSGFTAAAKNSLPAIGMLLTGTGYSLILLVGLIHSGDLEITSGFTTWLAVWAVVVIVFAILLAAQLSAKQTVADAEPMPRAVRAFFTAHLVISAPVGLVMYLAPGLAQIFWPWPLPPINIRLIGAMFVVTGALSFWCIRQRAWDAVAPTLMTYATFSTLSLIASLIHFNLFNPGRIVTWGFLALYAVVAGAAWYFLWDHARPRRAFS
jgi:hypothetical protein